MYELVRIARGQEIIIEEGSRATMQARLRELRNSTRRGVSGRGKKKYSVTYRLQKKTRQAAVLE